MTYDDWNTPRRSVASTRVVRDISVIVVTW